MRHGRDGRGKQESKERDSLHCSEDRKLVRTREDGGYSGKGGEGELFVGHGKQKDIRLGGQNDNMQNLKA